MNRSKNGKMTCKEAFEIAEKMNIKPIVVGKTLDELKIKITGCQLGCFK
ncbi:MAG: hypothetical protein SVZ03_06920 [Spirochaetota bacterium]|nr:hypothetical protein [Spirochaetota bacterium]